MKISAVIMLLAFSLPSFAEMPDWYRRDIVAHINSSYGVVIYRVKKITYESAEGPYRSYRIDGETVEELKGSAPSGSCYMIHTEGDWASPYKIGEMAMVILRVQYQGECGAIEPGFSAPATEDYVDFFRSVIERGA